MQAPHVAELLARWLVTGEAPSELAAFDPDRFEGVVGGDETTLTTDYYSAYTQRTSE
jgi:hypothetical protein